MAVAVLMPIPELPWWPPAGNDRLTEDQGRELFAHLRIVVPPVMEDARRRIRERVGDEPIEIHPETIMSMAGRRLGSVEVVPLVHLWARNGEDTVSVAIGTLADGQLETLEGTPPRSCGHGWAHGY